MKRRLFEIPYNFDKQLIYQLAELYNKDLWRFDISSIYMQAFDEDFKCTIRDGNGFYHDGTRESYEEHVNFVNQHFPNKLMLLLQEQNEDNMSDDIIMYYWNLGFHKFCVNGVEKAKFIKELYPDAEIWSSITSKFDPTQLEEGHWEDYKGIFDGIMLFWNPFNRDIKILSKLPGCYKYSIIANCNCEIFCPHVTEHWFNSEFKNQDLTKICPAQILKSSRNDSMFGDEYIDWHISKIPPQDIILFDKYIYSYKLQDRGWSTDIIISSLQQYCDLPNKPINYNWYVLPEELKNKIGDEKNGN